VQVMLKAGDGSLAMAAVRADDLVDLGKLSSLVATLNPQHECPCYILADEADFASTFAHVELGVAPAHICHIASALADDACLHAV
jgi:hypothetical protein